MYDWDKDGKISAEEDSMTVMVMDDDEIPGKKKKRKRRGCSCGCVSTILLFCIILAAVSGIGLWAVLLI